MSEPDYLTLAEVAKLLRVSKPTVVRAVRDFGLPGVQMTQRVWRFRRVDVEDWITKGGRNGGRAA